MKNTKLSSDSPRIALEDLDRVRSAGWDDEAIYSAITDEAHRAGGKRSATSGYVRK